MMATKHYISYMIDMGVLLVIAYTTYKVVDKVDALVECTARVNTNLERLNAVLDNAVDSAAYRQH